MHKNVVEGLPRLARARRGAQEGRHRPPPARARRARRCCGWPTRTASRRTCGRRARRACSSPTCASSTSTRPEDDAGRAARGGARGARPAGRARPAELGQDLRLEGLPHRRSARRRGRASTRSRASPTAVGEALVARDPERLTLEFSKADRGGRIYVDTGRNGYSATFAAAYAVRAQAGRAGVRAVHLGRDRERRGRPARLHAADDGRAGRPRWETSGPSCAGSPSPER